MTDCRASPAERSSSTTRSTLRRQHEPPQPGYRPPLQSYDRLYFDPTETTDLYTRQCSLNVSARDLAVMGATLADGGVNPHTGERVVDADTAGTRWR